MHLKASAKSVEKKQKHCKMCAATTHDYRRCPNKSTKSRKKNTAIRKVRSITNLSELDGGGLQHSNGLHFKNISEASTNFIYIDPNRSAPIVARCSWIDSTAPQLAKIPEARKGKGASHKRRALLRLKQEKEGGYHTYKLSRNRWKDLIGTRFFARRKEKLKRRLKLIVMMMSE